MIPSCSNEIDLFKRTKNFLRLSLIQKKQFFWIICILIFSCNSPVFSQCPDCDSLVRSFPSVISGIKVDTFYTGSVSDFGSTYMAQGCSVAAGPLRVGQFGPFTLTFRFSCPVNNILLALNAANNRETFSFTTNAGSLLLDACTPNSCQAFSQTGNTLTGFGIGIPGSSAILTVSSTNPYTSITITGSGGQAGSMIGLCAKQTIAPPPLVVSPSQRICKGDSVTLTVSGGNSYSWSPATGLSNTSGATVVAHPVTTTVYTVTSSDTSNCTGYTNTATVEVKVNALPAVSVNSSSICSGSSATLTAGGAHTYNWSPSTGLSAINGSTVAANPNATTSYAVSGTDTNGCVNVAVSTVTVISNPVITVNTASICLGQQSALLTANGATTYAWSPATGLSSTSGSSVTATPVITTIYSVTGTNGICTSVTTTTVVVNPLPKVSVNNGSICSGNHLLLNAGGANVYNWSPSTGLSATTGSSVTANPMVTTHYTVTGTNSHGCMDTAVALVTLYPTPVINISSSVDSGCVPLCVNFAISPALTGNYNWNLGDGTISSVPAPYHCYNTSGNRTVQLHFTDNNNCINSSSLPVKVFPRPVAAFNASPQPTTILDPNIQFTDQSSGAVIVNWIWNMGDPKNSYSFQQNPSFIYSDTGTYSVKLIITSDHHCSDSIIHPVTIDDFFTLYVPNAFTPNNDGRNENFLVQGLGIKEFVIRIFDRWGSLTFESKDMNSGWNGTLLGKGAESCPEDVYIWIIELQQTNGKKRELRGTVSLVK